MVSFLVFGMKLLIYQMILYSRSVLKAQHKQLAFIWLPCLFYMISQLFGYICDIMLTLMCYQEATTILDLLVKHFHIKQNLGVFYPV